MKKISELKRQLDRNTFLYKQVRHFSLHSQDYSHIWQAYFSLPWEFTTFTEPYAIRHICNLQNFTATLAGYNKFLVTCRTFHVQLIFFKNSLSCTELWHQIWYAFAAALSSFKVKFNIWVLQIIKGFHCLWMKQKITYEITLCLYA